MLPMAEPVRGSLLLVPNTLDHGCPADVEAGPIESVLAEGVLRRAASLAHWVVEDARSARAFLKRVGTVSPLTSPIQGLDIQELPRPRKGAAEAVPPQRYDALLAAAVAGHDIGLLSEAGLPAVADPGARLVEAAHRLGLRVWPLAGASALMLALAASGFDGQHFAFAGYLPQEAAQRTRALLELESQSRRAGQTQIFIETPYRNPAMFAAMLGCLSPSTRISVSCGLTLASGWTHTASVQQWRAAPREPSDRVPAVFVLSAR